MVKWLSEQRADNREGNKDGTRSLGVASQFGHLEVAKWLKEQGVDVGEKDSPYSRGLLYCSDSGILPGNNFIDSYFLSRPTTTSTIASESIR